MVMTKSYLAPFKLRLGGRHRQSLPISIRPGDGREEGRGGDGGRGRHRRGLAAPPGEEGGGARGEGEEEAQVAAYQERVDDDTAFPAGFRLSWYGICLEGRKRG